GYLYSVAFSPYGGHLATGTNDTTVLIWDLPGLPLRGENVAEPSPKALEALWPTLAGEDAVAAGRAVALLRRFPKAGLPYLEDRLKREAAPDAETVDKIKRLIRDLDADEFDVREKATSELGSLGVAAQPALRAALEGEPSAEARRRLKGLLAKMGTLDP